jgi:hypothetical protein
MTCLASHGGVVSPTALQNQCNGCSRHLEIGNVNVTADTRKTNQMSFHMTAATWARHQVRKLLQRVVQLECSHCLLVVVHRLPPGMHNRS